MNNPLIQFDHPSNAERKNVILIESIMFVICMYHKIVEMEIPNIYTTFTWGSLGPIRVLNAI